MRLTNSRYFDSRYAAMTLKQAKFCPCDVLIKHGSVLAYRLHKTMKLTPLVVSFAHLAGSSPWTLYTVLSDRSPGVAVVMFDSISWADDVQQFTNCPMLQHSSVPRTGGMVAGASLCSSVARPRISSV
eukprot:scaffold233605_cov17-Prasinocladus_malaysianus.AAC.1